jgi:hypothetical protein
MTFDADAGLHLPTPDADLAERRRVQNALGLGKPDPEFDQFARDLAREAGVPYAMVNLFTADEQHFVGLHSDGGDLPAVGRTMPRDHGYCPEVVDRRKSLVLPDVMAHPRFAGNTVVDKIGIRTYAGAPLIDPSTEIVLGTVCFVGLEQLPRETGQASLALIKQRAEDLMQLIYERAGNPDDPQQR